jgi:protein involved in polysaccharide export with SLBB domain
LSLILTKIRSVKVTIIGAKKSGNYSVSSLSTVFNALHIAGGPNENGSFRQIELIRANKVLRVIDIYKFLLNGDQSDNINLQDNDIIKIPVYSSRIKIEGRVKRPGIFELLPNETFEDLLKYCSGFDESAYKSNIKLIQNTDKEMRIQDLSENDYKKYVPKSGDVFKIGTILNRFENKISIKGAVYRPDDYAFYEGMSVKDLLDKADGLTEDAYLNKALIIRLKDDLTKEIFDIDQQYDLLTVFGSCDYISPNQIDAFLERVYNLSSRQIIIVSSLRGIPIQEAQKLVQAVEIKRYDVGYVQPLFHFFSNKKYATLKFEKMGQDSQIIHLIK